MKNTKQTAWLTLINHQEKMPVCKVKCVLTIQNTVDYSPYNETEN